MLYGCVMMLIPCVLMVSMMMWSFVKGTALYAQTTASREYVLEWFHHFRIHELTYYSCFYGLNVYFLFIYIFLSTLADSCESVAVWGGVQIALCVCNFFFTWFLFTNLRRNTEERDYLYRRDLGELFEHYQVCVFVCVCVRVLRSCSECAEMLSRYV